ncbi:hypothetical protein ACQPU1_04850 [Clostridium paraputrificum]|uniref:hypothetical protein n=1 Tax=Clostridium paraputrificum TaxID=29363 RepID=UPI003D3420F3
MFNEINTKIKECKEEMILRNTLEKKLGIIQDSLDIKKRLLEVLKKNLDKEFKDVERLEKMSMANILSTILRNKEEKLYKEEQEYLEAKLRYQECLEVVNGYENDIDSIKLRIKNIDNYEEQYEKLIKEKYELIKSLDKEKKEKLQVLENLLEIDTKERREVLEAITAGKECFSIIRNAGEALDSAKSWGTYDMIGGGVMSSIVKHDKLDTARKELNKLGYSIGRLNMELSDIDMVLAIDDLTFDSSTYAFDVFFDNIFTDMSVQDKIKDSLSKIRRLENRVNNLINQLEEKELKVSESICRLNDEIYSLIENA